MANQMGEQRRRRRCEVPGCISFARGRGDFCHAHRHTPPDPAPEDLPYGGRLVVAEAERLAERRAEFLQRIQAGTFRELYGARIGQLITEAAALPGVEDELGALRFSMAKALAEIEDAEVLARTLATIAAGVARLVRVQADATGERKNMLAAAIYDLLGELDA